MFARENMSFCPTRPSNNMQNNGGQAPASPPRMGYVAGAESRGEMNGYVGGKPATREASENSQSRRQLVNLASPDPTLAQSAFTQSLFTQNVSAASAQAAEMRESQRQQNDETLNDEEEAPLDPRRASLRRFKESNSGGSRGGSMMGVGARFAPQRGQQQQQGTGRGNGGGIGRVNVSDVGRPGVVARSEAVTSSSTFVTYTLADVNLMYKAFSGNVNWFRVVQLVIPEGKKPKKVYISCMLVKDDSPENNVYSLRLVNPSETPAKTLWAEYDANNIDTFKVYTVDVSNFTVSSSLLEIQAHHTRGNPILFSTIVVELL